MLRDELNGTHSQSATDKGLKKGIAKGQKNKTDCTNSARRELTAPDEFQHVLSHDHLRSCTHLTTLFSQNSPEIIQNLFDQNSIKFRAKKSCATADPWSGQCTCGARREERQQPALNERVSVQGAQNRQPRLQK
jgi:hypothetical protein